MNMRGNSWEMESKMYCGRMHETDCFGNALKSDDIRQAMAALPHRDDGKFERLSDVFKVVMEHQEDDPTNPRKAFARDLRLAIADELDLETDDDLNRLKFYNAIGTEVDVLLGVDAFVEYADVETGKTYRVTFDATLNSDKMQTGHKADVLVGEIHDVFSDESKYLEDVDSVAEAAVSAIKRRIENNRRLMSKNSLTKR